MDTNQLLELIKRYHDNRDFITNEETAKMALVVPFIRLLGYDTNLPREVRLEYTAEFTQGDGKRLADRMDFAIFDKAGVKPLLVIETKPLGTDLAAKSNQLARYIAQVADLHFGIITDGCVYLFYGDLENPNQMDREPFFRFALDDPNADWGKVATFLSKFSREAFNAETLVTDAENSRYRQAMVERLARVLKAPAADEGFMRWLTDDIYKGKRTTAVMTRFAELAREAVEPALFRVIGEDFLARLKERIQQSGARKPGAATEEAAAAVTPPAASAGARSVAAAGGATATALPPTTGLPAPVSGAKAVRFWIGNRSWSVRFWRDLPVNTCTFLAETRPEKFKAAFAAEEFLGRKQRLLSPTAEGCRTPVAVPGGFVEVNLSAAYCVDLAQRLLVFCGVDPSTAGYESQTGAGGDQE